MRLAKAEQNLPLALELMDLRPGGALDRVWLDAKVNLLVAANQRPQALATFTAHVLAAQARLTEEDFRALSALAEDAGLPAVLDLLDASRPVGPAFLAYLRDLRPAEAGRFHTADPRGFRAALAYRWQARERQLNAEQIRTWLRELWAQDQAPLPRRGLVTLGGPWPHAAAWLERLPVSERLARLEELETALQSGTANPTVFAQLAHPGSDDALDLLAIRVRLARGEVAQAQALAEGLLAGLQRGEALTYQAPERLPERDSGGEEGEDAAPAERNGGDDPLVARLRAWLQPFRDAKAAAPLEAKVRQFLKARRQEGTTALAAWKLAFELSPPGEAEELGQDLEAAWFRGEVSAEALGPLTEALATTLPTQTPRWLARWPRRHTYAAAAQRAAILMTLKQPAEAVTALLDSRSRAPWEATEEVQAFDRWRRMGAPLPATLKVPAAWSEALPAWTCKADAVVGPLKARLQQHPLDVLSARAALRSPSAADEDGLLRAGLALGSSQRQDGEGDQLLLRLRAARGLLPAPLRPPTGRSRGSPPKGWPGC